MKNCSHIRFIEISARCKDMCWVRWLSGRDVEGYVPSIPGLGGGDYLHMQICTDCGHVIGWNPNLRSFRRAREEAEKNDSLNSSSL